MAISIRAHVWKKEAASMKVIREIADSWTTKHPELKSRIQKAIPLTLAITKEGPNTYIVENPDSDQKKPDPDPKNTKNTKTHPEYIVTVKGNTSTCTCEDYIQRKSQCKHRLAVGLLVVSDKKETPQDRAFGV